MTEVKEFKLPDVGEGLTEADIVAWHVKPGDRVEDGQVIVEIETAKAVVELPSPWDGTVARLLAEVGQTVDVGVPIIAIQLDSPPSPADAAPSHPAVSGAAVEKTDYAERALVPPAATADQSAAGEPEPQPSRPQPSQPQPSQPQRQAVLVGYGVKASATTRRARKVTATRPETAEVPTGPETPVTALRLPAAPSKTTESTLPAESARTTVRALAKPPVRKLAKDLGISLAELTGSGPDGSITRDDVQQAAGDTTVRSAQMVSGNGTGAA